MHCLQLDTCLSTGSMINYSLEYYAHLLGPQAISGQSSKQVIPNGEVNKDEVSQFLFWFILTNQWLKKKKTTRSLSTLLYTPCISSASCQTVAIQVSAHHLSVVCLVLPLLLMVMSALSQPQPSSISFRSLDKFLPLSLYVPLVISYPTIRRQCKYPFTSPF